MSITCNVYADSDRNYAGDSNVWRGNFNYSNGASIPFKATIRLSDSDNIVARIIVVVNSSKTYRRRVRFMVEDIAPVFNETLKEAVRDFWPQTKCPFGIDIKEKTR